MSSPSALPKPLRGFGGTDAPTPSRRAGCLTERANSPTWQGAQAPPCCKGCRRDEATDRDAPLWLWAEIRFSPFSGHLNAFLRGRPKPGNSARARARQSRTHARVLRWVAQGKRGHTLLPSFVPRTETASLGGVGPGEVGRACKTTALNVGKYREDHPEPRDLDLPSPPPRRRNPLSSHHPVQRMSTPSPEGLIAAAASGNMISASTLQPLARDRVRVLGFRLGAVS